jgi:hypothetical protein
MLSERFPRLEYFAKNRTGSVLGIMQTEDLDSIFMLPLSQQAFDEFQQLQVEIQEFHFEEHEKDSWHPTWGDNYNSKKFYSTIYDLLDAHPIFIMIWK